MNSGVIDESGLTLLELAMKFDGSAVVDYLNPSTCEFYFFLLKHDENIFINHKINSFPLHYQLYIIMSTS